MIFRTKTRLSPTTKSLPQEKNQPKHRFTLNKKTAWLLLLCQCLNISVIAMELSTWMLSVIVLSLVWQAILLNKKYALVNKNNKREKNARVQKKVVAKRLFSGVNFSTISLALFAILGCIAIAVTAKQVGLLISMLHLLCFSYAIKAFELKARSDFYQLSILGIFVLASSLIFRQNLAFSMLVLALLVINLAVLLQFFSTAKKFLTDIKVIVILLAQSAVLAVVLFLFFPRLSPFWQMPTNKSAQTGLSDSVKPGDIANLTRSTKLAFRADFNQQSIPNYSQLYWRAMVLENYDGRQWTRNKQDSRIRSKDNLATKLEYQSNTSLEQDFRHAIVASGVAPLNYQITVEPSFQKYLFVLAPAVLATDEEGVISSINNAVNTKINAGIKANEDYTFSSEKIISQAQSYQLTSYLSAPLSLVLSNNSRNINLKYPQGSNPKLEQLSLTLKQDYPEPEDRAQAVLDQINQQEFSYTLQPPPLSNNSLDQFYFDTQAGFCVHYASTFTFIMRASGIPARMVTGYLGGEYNGSNTNESNTEQTQQGKTKGHLSIYQYDAHAWSEIWIENKGWIRVDPTSAVDPQRVNSGWSNDLLQQQSNLNNDFFSLYQVKNIKWMNSLRLQFDALDYQWTRWVIGFTSERQIDLFKRWFGKMASWKLALIIAVSLTVSMLILLLLLHFINRAKRIPEPLTPWQILYSKTLRQLAKQGIEKPVSMTTNDFAKFIREQYPELALSFTRLTVSYNALCYQPLPLEEKQKMIALLTRQSKEFISILKKLN
ncbi:transglutaminase TgpA family protein [Colwellia echini]|uniref:DUF3488 domain-containing protein n=1 Tax=Colwellia echini TaxID=1982103 RepID=A0ABY3MTP3_9GAMM|nr:DUF3488 and transglutaminase-like domain-containing protein [Colwellia echini]TYK64559.1 DUF3488 domain-containing protein [Colwellia echini]